MNTRSLSEEWRVEIIQRARMAREARKARQGRAIFIALSVVIVVFAATLAILASGSPMYKFPPCGKHADGQVSRQGCYNACTAGCNNLTARSLCYRACDEKFDGGSR